MAVRRTLDVGHTAHVIAGAEGIQALSTDVVASPASTTSAGSSAACL